MMDCPAPRISLDDDPQVARPGDQRGIGAHSGTPGATRTHNLGFRRASLYPFELLGLAIIIPALAPPRARMHRVWIGSHAQLGPRLRTLMAMARLKVKIYRLKALR